MSRADAACPAEARSANSRADGACPAEARFSDIASGGGQREHMVALRFHLPFLPMERVLPNRIGATAPRRTGGERHVLTPSNFVHRRNAFGIRFELLLPENGAGAGVV